MTLFSVLSIANIVVILQYVHELKEEQCSCSVSVARTIMQVIAILYAFFYIMLFIILIYTGFKISSIVELSKKLSTNNPKDMTKVLSKTFKSAKKAFSK
jgi:chromate transport protein ChrA